MTEDQANAIIDTITGLPRDHCGRLDVARDVGETLIEAANRLSDPDCECGHPREEHGDGVLHTGCCLVEGNEMCECPEYEGQRHPVSM